MPRYIPCPLTVFFVQIWSHFVILVIKSINRVEKPYDQVLQHSQFLPGGLLGLNANMNLSVFF